MTRKNAFWLALMLAVFGYTPLLHAQGAAGASGSSVGAGGLVALIQTVGGKAYPDPNYRQTPISKAQCEADANISFTLTGIPTALPVVFLEAWVGTSCDQAMRGTRAAGTESCSYVSTSDQLTTGTTQLPAYEVPVAQLCQKDGMRSLFILVVNQKMGADASQVYARVDLLIDKDPPDPATQVKGGAGETEISVSWKEPVNNPYTYKIVLDTNATTGGDAGTGTTCSSDELVAGAEIDLDNLPQGVKTISIDKKVSHTTLSGDQVGSDLAAVAVLAFDRAGNQSKLSNIDCIHVVPTTGFWARYKAAGGDAKAGCAVSPPGGHTRNDRAALLTLLGLGCVWAARRSLRRRS